MSFAPANLVTPGWLKDSILSSHASLSSLSRTPQVESEQVPIVNIVDNRLFICYTFSIDRGCGDTIFPRDAQRGVTGS